MLGFLTDSIENALTVGQKLLTLELPSKREVAKLVEDGVETVVIAQTFGVAESVILDMLKK